MKIALYIEDGLEQITLTPETPFERQLLPKLYDGDRMVSVKTGNFYHCQGGYARHGDHHSPTSVMLVLTKPKTGEDRHD